MRTHDGSQYPRFPGETLTDWSVIKTVMPAAECRLLRRMPNVSSFCQDAVWTSVKSVQTGSLLSTVNMSANQLASWVTCSYSSIPDKDIIAPRALHSARFPASCECRPHPFVGGRSRNTSYCVGPTSFGENCYCIPAKNIWNEKQIFFLNKFWCYEPRLKPLPVMFHVFKLNNVTRSEQWNITYHV